MSEESWVKKVDIMLSRPPPKPVTLDSSGSTIPCSGCRKPMAVEEVQYHWTGIFRASDALCSECTALTPKHALVACVNCQSIVARMAPETLRSGFRIESRKIYHTDACPDCRPDVTTSSIIEAKIHRDGL
jgi:hypothetical protein